MLFKDFYIFNYFVSLICGLNLLFPNIQETAVGYHFNISINPLFFFNTGNSSWIPPPGSGIAPIHPDEPAGKHVWLFNIQDDPNEYHDLSDVKPDIVKQLVGRLQYYYSSLVPPFYPPGDPRANPALHGGIWTNWE